VDDLAAKGDPLPPLAGIPVGIKDVLVMRGAPATAGSKILEGYRPPYDATAVSKLEAAGAVLLGKLNCDEFAMGSSNENSAYGPVRNPVDTERVPGGSSGGSAAAVAANLAVATLGSDTGGSIRQPASFCGVVGVLPTYGRVSRYGLIAFASSLDRVGPFAANVRDAATMLGVIAGYDPKDATCSQAPVPDYAAESDKPAEGLRIGVPAEYFAEGLDPEVRAAIEKGIAALKAAGCVIKPISLPHTKYAIPTYYLVATAEASANLARFDGVRFGHRTDAQENLQAMYCNSRDEGFGPEVKRRIFLGTYALSAGYYDAYYKKAQQVRRLLAEDFLCAFADVDAIVTPTSPVPAFRLGEKADDPLAMYLADIYTVTASLAGICGVSVPCGATEAGLPVGMQVLAAHMNEGTAFRVARAVEEAGIGIRD
jgi:aspartyl-tRNA(Asn)/glutamyl-tRNA(Gln) amidotransferase subunit A